MSLTQHVIVGYIVYHQNLTVHIVSFILVLHPIVLPDLLHLSKSYLLLLWNDDEMHQYDGMSSQLCIKITGTFYFISFAWGTWAARQVK